MATNRVGRAFQPPQIFRYRFVFIPTRQPKVRIIGLCESPGWRFIHHQITATRLDGRLEAIDRLDQVHELLGTLTTRELNAKAR
jgi:hypothetical protein